MSLSTTYEPPATFLRVGSIPLASIGCDDWEEGNTSIEQAPQYAAAEKSHASPGKAEDELALALEAHYSHASPPSSSGEHETFQSFGIKPNFVESLMQKDAEDSYVARNVRKERRQKRKKRRNRKAASLFESLHRDGKKTNNASTERNGKVSFKLCIRYAIFSDI